MINTFSVTGLIAWLETQDPATEYPYSSNDDCLLCRYFRARGVSLGGLAPMGSMTWGDATGNDHILPPELNRVSRGYPWTYGAALARAKATLVEPTP